MNSPRRSVGFGFAGVESARPRFEPFADRSAPVGLQDADRLAAPEAPMGEGREMQRGPAEAGGDSGGLRQVPPVGAAEDQVLEDRLEAVHAPERQPCRLQLLMGGPALVGDQPVEPDPAVRAVGAGRRLGGGDLPHEVRIRRVPLSRPPWPARHSFPPGLRRMAGGHPVQPARARPRHSGRGPGPAALGPRRSPRSPPPRAPWPRGRTCEQGPCPRGRGRSRPS